MSKPRIVISFSGGRTSAVMTRMLLQQCKDTHEIMVVFANTGQEHTKTLDFVKSCDDRLRFGTVWVEAVINPEHGKGVRHKVVTYETASSDGRPFREYIAKYGIPNMGSPKCTGVLKECAITSFLRSKGWGPGTYDTAIGIRADEMDRMSVRAKEARFIYPLVKAGYTKADVVAKVRSWGFDLGIPEHEGNCRWCWKKTRRKLLTLAVEDPAAFDFPAQMEKEFGQFKVTPATASPCGRRLFFRGHKSAADILEMAKQPFEKFTDKYYIPFDENLDIGGGCGDSCEIGSDERYGGDIEQLEPEDSFWS